MLLKARFSFLELVHSCVFSVRNRRGLLVSILILVLSRLASFLVHRGQ
jgi:hypothetical protein